jgi:hypothetical protein
MFNPFGALLCAVQVLSQLDATTGDATDRRKRGGGVDHENDDRRPRLPGFSWPPVRAQPTAPPWPRLAARRSVVADRPGDMEQVHAHQFDLSRAGAMM